MLKIVLILVCLACVCSSQDHHHLKIAEKLAIPHHIRHNYDYPQINLGQRPVAQQNAPRIRPQISQGGGFGGPAFSQPDPFSMPAAAPSFNNGPSRPASGQFRQTRFFNLYTPNSRPSFRPDFERQF